MSRIRPDRRQFTKLLATAAALGLVEDAWVARLGEPDRLSFRANRTAGAEGAWRPKVVGKIPGALHGTLFRTAPGQSSNHGVLLKHFFDGDAYVTGWSFRDGKVFMRGKFVETPERKRELAAGKMLYKEFGTVPPGGASARSKNQPSVNLIHWDGRLLGLSEGWHPAAIDPKTLAHQGWWNFHGSLTPDTPFTAHPKFHPETGVGYGYGIKRGRGLPLTVFRMEKDGRLTKLHEVPLPQYYMIHDMILTRKHIVFLIPPVTFGQGDLSSDQRLRYAADQPLKIVVLDIEGKGEPKTIDMGAQMVFHHANGFERDDRLVIDTVLSPDDSILELLRSFSKDELPGRMPSRMTRLEVDLAKGTVGSRIELLDECEFPRFDERRMGTDLRFLNILQAQRKDDGLAFSRLSRFDLGKRASIDVDAKPHEVFGEPVFVPHPDGETEDAGWVVHMGYDGRADKSFVDIRDASTLERAARVVAPTNIPLGFHGNFVSNAFVADVD